MVDCRGFLCGNPLCGCCFPDIPIAPAKIADASVGTQHAPGVKLDAGKNRADLVIGDFARALKAVCEVGTFGANKYTPHGWLSVEDGIQRYADAHLRHFLERKSGVDRDAESKMLHLAHECWNKLAELELTLRKEESPSGVPSC